MVTATDSFRTSSWSLALFWRNVSLDVGADACKLPDWPTGLHKSARSIYSYHQNELTLHVLAF